MATVNINEILGTDSISGSRITINSNFLILQNWINGYVSVFGVDTANGILDVSLASTGKVQAKIGRFNQLAIPSSGTSLASIDQTGAALFASVQTTTFTSSGSLVANGTITLGTGSSFSSGGTASFNGQLGANGALLLGPQGRITSQNTTYLNGLTAGQAFAANNALSGAGGGVATAINTPYAITGLEDVIYANCASPGFYMKACDGTSPVGGTVPSIAPGTRITIVNTSSSAGYIVTGITGSSQYYTGFNTFSAYGGFNSPGITAGANKAYRSSLTLQWEPRVGKGQGSQNGSWVVLGSSNITA
jgi:hypothetical protein